MSREEAERLFPSTPPPSNQKDRRDAWDRMQLQLFYSVLNGIAEGVVVVLPDGVITFFNAAAKEMFGLSDADLQHRNLFHDLFSKADGETENALEQRFLTEGRVLRERTTIQHPTGKEMRIELTLTPSVIGDIQARVVVTCRDVTLEEEQRRELEECAVTDPMTGFLNRRGFASILEQIGRQPVCCDDLYVLFIDLDDFGWVNKDHQMKAGDRIICQAANLIRGCIRKTDHAVRFGGDEFVLILEGAADERSALRVAHDILESLRETAFPIEGTTETCRVTASIGIACMHRAKYTSSHFIVNAEFAKHQAKVLGKNQVCVFHRDMAGR